MNRYKTLSLVPLIAALILVISALAGRHWNPQGRADSQPVQTLQETGAIPTHRATSLPPLPGTIVELRYSPAGRAFTLRVEPQEMLSMWQNLPSWSGLRQLDVTRGERHWTVNADLWPVGTHVPDRAAMDASGTDTAASVASVFLPIPQPQSQRQPPAAAPLPQGQSQPLPRTGVVRFSGGHPMLWRWDETVLSLEAQ